MKGSGFKENVVIITGASSGIGCELARNLAKQGAWLSLAARRMDILTSVVEECLALGGRAIAIPTDVSEEDQCRNLIDETVKEYGRIDTLIYGAAITVWAKFEDVNVLFPFEKVMQVNYLGGLYCTHYALPYLKESRGRIVPISSLAGLTGVPYRSGYSASKFAMKGFFETLRIEIAEYRVSVTMIFPDYVQTGTRLQAFGPNGEKLERNPDRKGKVITADVAANMITKAITKRQRELIMSTRGRIGKYIQVFAPGLVDRFAKKAIERTR